MGCPRCHELRKSIIFYIAGTYTLRAYGSKSLSTATKAKVLRQIMSNKARFYARVNGAQNLLTVVLTSFLGFIGEVAWTKVQIYLGWFMDADKLKGGVGLQSFGVWFVCIGHLASAFSLAKAN